MAISNTNSLILRVLLGALVCVSTAIIQYSEFNISSLQFSIFFAIFIPPLLFRMRALSKCIVTESQYYENRLIVSKSVLSVLSISYFVAMFIGLIFPNLYTVGPEGFLKYIAGVELVVGSIFTHFVLQIVEKS